MIYALLIHRTLAAAAPGAARRDRETHAAPELQAQSAAACELHLVAGLDEPDTTRTVRIAPNAHVVTDGRLIETKEWLVGRLRAHIAALEPGPSIRRVCPS